MNFSGGVKWSWWRDAMFDSVIDVQSTYLQKEILNSSVDEEMAIKDFKGVGWSKFRLGLVVKEGLDVGWAAEG